jgi:hypothetical protein
VEFKEKCSHIRYTEREMIAKYLQSTLVIIIPALKACQEEMRIGEHWNTKRLGSILIPTRKDTRQMTIIETFNDARDADYACKLWQEEDGIYGVAVYFLPLMSTPHGIHISHSRTQAEAKFRELTGEMVASAPGDRKIVTGEHPVQ